MNYTDLRQAFYKFKTVTDKGITFLNPHNEEKYVPYNDLYVYILKMAEFLKLNSIDKNSKIIFQIDSVEMFVYCFWACIVNEYYAIPLEPVKNKESRNKVINICDQLTDAFIITTEKQYKNLEEVKNVSNCKILIIEDFLKLDITEKSSNESPINLADKIAFIQFSSGSTGNPKGVILSHRNLISNINAIQDGINLNNDDTGLSWLPLTHDMGLIGFHLTPACKLINHIIIDTKTFVFNPSIWIKMIDKYRATITCSPNFGYKFLLAYLCKKKLQEQYDLSSVRVIFNGAEPISYETTILFIEEMKKFNLKSNVIFPVYGLAEGTLAVSFPDVNDDIRYLNVNKGRLSIGNEILLDDNGLKIVCEGRNVPGVQVDIMNNNHKVNEGIIGGIYISGDNVAKRFLIKNKEINSLDKDNRLYTGDIGFIYKDELYVIGRESELIVNGKNYFCSDAEELIEREFNIKYKFVLIPVKINEDYKVIAFVKHKVEKKIVEIFSKMKDKVYLETSILLEGIVFTNSIPKTTSGKIKRFQLVQEFYNGEYGEIIFLHNEDMKSHNYSELEENILELFYNAYNEKPPINKDVSPLFNESLKNITFLISIEEFYNIKLNFDDFIRVTTIKEICEKVSTYL